MKPLSEFRLETKKKLKERWNGLPRKLSITSPFGTTTDQLQDYRGFSFLDEIGKPKPKTANTNFKNIDLSDTDLSSTIFENCSFESCLFANSNLQDVTFGKCKFLHCFFKRTDLRLAGIGIDGAEFDSCEFLHPKLKRISFHRVTFRNTDFDGKDWCNVSFGIADFWNCGLRGMFRNCQFQDLLMLPTDFKGLGFHDVDMSAAEFSLVDFPDDWIFENVKPPRSQSVKIVKANTLRSALNFYQIASKQHNILKKYISYSIPNRRDDQTCFVSKHDLLELGDAEAAAEVFNQLSPTLPFSSW